MFDLTPLEERTYTSITGTASGIKKKTPQGYQDTVKCDIKKAHISEVSTKSGK